MYCEGRALQTEDSRLGRLKDSVKRSLSLGSSISEPDHRNNPCQQKWASSAGARRRYGRRVGLAAASSKDMEGVGVA